MRISRALSRFLLVGCIVAAVAPYSLSQGERPGRGQGGGGPGGGGPGGPGGGGMRGFGGGMMGGGGMASLLIIKEVRDELKMDEEQTKEYEAFAKEIGEELRSQLGGFGGRGGAGGPGGGGADGGGRGAGGGGPGGGGRGGAGGGGGFTPPSEEEIAKRREAAAALQEKTEAKLGEILDPIQIDRLVGLYLQRDGVRTFSSKTISTRLEITPEQKTKFASLEKAAAEEMRAAFTPGAAPGGDFREIFEKARKESEEKNMAVLTAAQKAKMEELKGAKFEFPAPPARGGGPGGPGGAGGGRGNRGNPPQ